MRPLRTGREYISALGSGPFVDICCNGPRTCGGPCPLWGWVGGLAPWNRPAQGVRPGGVATPAPIRPGLRVAPEGCRCAGISGLLSGGRVCFLGRTKRPTALCQLELGWAGARPVPAAGGWGTAGDGSSPPPSCPRWPLRPQPAPPPQSQLLGGSGAQSGIHLMGRCSAVPVRAGADLR